MEEIIEKLEKENAAQKELIDRLYGRINHLQYLLNMAQIANGNNISVSQEMKKNSNHELALVDGNPSRKERRIWSHIQSWTKRIIRKVFAV